MRNLLLAGLFVCFSTGAAAFAEEAVTTDAVDTAAPTCMQVQLDQKTTTACFDLSESQVQSLQSSSTNNLSEQFRRRCEVRCVVYGRFGRCLRWRRYCW